MCAAESAQSVSLKVLIDELLVAILSSYSPNSGEFELGAAITQSLEYLFSIASSPAIIIIIII